MGIGDDIIKIRSVFPKNTTLTQQSSVSWSPCWQGTWPLGYEKTDRESRKAGHLPLRLPQQPSYLVFQSKWGQVKGIMSFEQNMMIDDDNDKSLKIISKRVSRMWTRWSSFVVYADLSFHYIAHERLRGFARHWSRDCACLGTWPRCLRQVN